MQIRGLKDIATRGATANRCVPRTRAQAAFQLGLLEQEKAKLERELSIWEANRGRAETRLRSANERSVFLRRYLEENTEDIGSAPKARAGRPKPASRTVSLEY